MMEDKRETKNSKEKSIEIHSENTVTIPHQNSKKIQHRSTDFRHSQKKRKIAEYKKNDEEELVTSIYKKQPSPLQHLSISAQQTYAKEPFQGEDDEFVGENATKKDDLHDKMTGFTISQLSKWIMFEKSSLSVWDTIIMIQTFTLRYNISQDARYALFQLCKVVAGPEFEKCQFSKHSLDKLLNPIQDQVSYLFFCDKCNVALENPISINNFRNNSTKLCPQCKENKNMSTSSEYYFTLINVESQLKLLLEDESVLQTLIQNNKKNYNRDNCNENIRDICDSERYKNNVLRAKANTNNDLVLSFNVNIGGKMLMNSSKSLWPIQMTINELPRKLRQKTLILAGLFYTRTEPKPKTMNLYLKYFIRQMTFLADCGIRIVDKYGVRRQVYFFVMTFPVDSVARPVLQNRLQHNGYYACSWCYIYGKSINGHVKYPLSSKADEYRTHAEYIVDALNAESINEFNSNHSNTKNRPVSTVRGVKGRSELETLPYFDCIDGFSAEYMHNILLGVVRQIWFYWKSTCLTNRQCEAIYERLTHIKPTKEIHRHPSIMKNMKQWHASDWEYWFLFYSVPCLLNILDDGYLKSYSLFVSAVYNLLSTEISEKMLINSEINIWQFVSDCEENYGQSFMTFNVHILLHLVHLVRLNGPLWATSAFAFENNIGLLKKEVTGPNAVMLQIAKKILQKNELKMNIAKLNKSKGSKLYSEKLFVRGKLKSNYVKSTEGAVLYGNVCQSNIFSKCIYNDRLLHSLMYSKSRKSDDTYIQLVNNKIGKIASFQLVENQCKVNIYPIQTKTLINYDVAHILEIVVVENVAINVPINIIKTKVVIVELGDDIFTKYVCIPPNNVRLL